VQANEPIAMMVRWIVVRPMNDRESSRVVNHLAGDFDGISGLNRATRCDADVIDDLEFAGAALHVERFVHAVRARAVEKVRRRCNRGGEIDPGRRGAGIGSSQIHRCSHHARGIDRQETEKTAR
jgi:hypothetical protein